MSAKIAIFGGTTEGREIAEWLAGKGVSTLLCVATAYGGGIVRDMPHLTVNIERLDGPGMEALLLWHGCRLVLDATHPYAVEVTANVKAACEKQELEYVRVVREEFEDGDVVLADSAAHAAELLNQSGEKALLTVGSKELAEFRSVRDFRNRLFARVLPSADVLYKCEALGFSGAQLISMQGPFTLEMNIAMIRMLGVDTIVTKDSGNAGGFMDKLEACRETGIKMMLIQRPVQNEEGLSLSEAMDLLRKRFSLPEDVPPAPEPDEPPEPAEPLEPAEPAEPAEPVSPTEPEEPQAEDDAADRRFPLFVRLEGVSAAVVGGGKIATRRVKTLLQFGADIRVIAPEITPELLSLAADNKIIWIKSEYDHAFLGSAVLVVAATNDRLVNLSVGLEAKRRQLFVSVADSRTEGSFTFPAVALQDGLIAGIVSENGDHAAVCKAAAKFRRVLEENA